MSQQDKVQQAINRTATAEVKQDVKPQETALQGQQIKTKEQRLAEIKLQVRKVFADPAKAQVDPSDVKEIKRLFEGVAVEDIISMLRSDKNTFTLPDAEKWQSYTSQGAKSKYKGQVIHTAQGRFEGSHNVVTIGGHRLLMNLSFSIYPVAKE